MVVERDQIQGDAVGGECGQTAVPATQVRDLGIIEGHCQVRGVAEDLVDQSGEHTTGPYLDESGDAISGHRLDHLPETH